MCIGEFSVNKFFIPFKNNKTINKKYLTRDELKQLKGTLCPQQMLLYNDKMRRFLYSSSSEREECDVKFSIEKNIKFYNKKIIKCDTSKYGLILVKPEMLLFEREVLSLLTRNGFVVVKNIHKKLNREQFMCLYKRQITSLETQFDLPTRMINIINKPVHVLIVKKSNSSNCAKELNALKGQIGEINDSTFRGIGAFCIGEIIKDATFEELYYIDPIQMARGNVKYNFGKDDSVFKNLKYPILFFIANCVHIPDYEELGEHTKILLTQKEISSYVDCS